MRTILPISVPLLLLLLLPMMPLLPLLLLLLLLLLPLLLLLLLLFLVLIGDSLCRCFSFHFANFPNLFPTQPSIQYLFFKGGYPEYERCSQYEGGDMVIEKKDPSFNLRLFSFLLGFGSRRKHLNAPMFKSSFTFETCPEGEWAAPDVSIGSFLFHYSFLEINRKQRYTFTCSRTLYSLNNCV